jgi:hypothetical protein
MDSSCDNWPYAPLGVGGLSASLSRGAEPLDPCGIRRSGIGDRDRYWSGELQQPCSVKMVTTVIHVVIAIIGGWLPVSCVSVLVWCAQSITRRATTITSVVHIVVLWSAPAIAFPLPHSICFHRRGIRRSHGVIVFSSVVWWGQMEHCRSCHL